MATEEDELSPVQDELLLLFVQKDLTEFMMGSSYAHIPAAKVENHIAGILDHAKAGDFHKVRFLMTDKAHQYFPEFDDIFPNWWINRYERS